MTNTAVFLPGRLPTGRENQGWCVHFKGMCAVVNIG